jgi:hypothetical protein
MNRQPKPFILPERNPLTHAKHRKEVFWQVAFPVAIGVVLFVVVLIALLLMTLNEAQDLQAMPTPASAGELGQDMVEMVYYQQDTTSRLAKVSEIWLIMQVMVFALVTLLVLSALVFLMTRFLGVMPGYMRIGQDFFALTSLRVGHVMDAIVEPFLKGKSAAAAARRVKYSAMQQASNALGKIAGEHDK